MLPCLQGIWLSLKCKECSSHCRPLGEQPPLSVRKEMSHYLLSFLYSLFMILPIQLKNMPLLIKPDQIPRYFPCPVVCIKPTCQASLPVCLHKTTKENILDQKEVFSECPSTEQQREHFQRHVTESACGWGGHVGITGGH